MSEGAVVLLPERVDARRLAEQGGALKGQCPAATLTRLAAQALEVEDATASLDFECDETGRVLVRGEVRGGIRATCQRCLEPVAIALTGEFEFRPDEEGEEFLPEPGSPAPATESELPVRALVEDELLLLCPMIPCHPPGTCEAADSAGSAGQSSLGSERKNPFDVLAALRQNAEDPPSEPAAARNPEE
ncbi:MAG: hypothetical protein RL434_984 [Pseudomonadota bacterium]|jgi:uncharacterized protein